MTNHDIAEYLMSEIGKAGFHADFLKYLDLSDEEELEALYQYSDFNDSDHPTVISGLLGCRSCC